MSTSIARRQGRGPALATPAPVCSGRPVVQRGQVCERDWLAPVAYSPPPALVPASRLPLRARFHHQITRQRPADPGVHHGPTALPPSPCRSSTGILPLLVLLFIGSGCAALIYEIVWFQLLSLIDRLVRRLAWACCSARSWAACASAACCSRSTSRAQQHPLRVYAMLEARDRRVRPARALGHAVRRRVVLQDRRARHERRVPPRPVLRDLPAAADDPHGRDAARDRALGRERRRKAWRGSASSTAATSPARCSAALLAGFYLLRVHDMAYATYVAVAIDLVVALASLALAKVDVPRCARRRTRRESTRRRAAHSARHVARLRDDRALRRDGARRRSGVDATAVAAARRDDVHLLAHSRRVPHRTRHRQQRRLDASRARRRIRDARSASARLLLDGGDRVGRVLDDATRSRTGRSARVSRPTPSYSSRSISCAVCGPCCPRRCLWGASFPLALAAVGRDEKDPARLVGTVYAANTIGGIIGALFGSLLIIAWLGTQNAQRILIATGGDQRARRARAVARAGHGRR